MKNKWNQRTAILAAAALTLTTGVAVEKAMAYFTTYVVAEGSHELDLGFSITEPYEKVENWTKHITIQNTSENPCYVRVKVFAGSRYPLEFEDKSGGNWIKGKDDYYYWTGILSPQGTKDENGKLLDQTGELLAKIVEKAVQNAQDQQQSVNVIVVQECTPVPYDDKGNPLTWDKVDWNRTADVIKTETKQELKDSEKGEEGNS